MTAAVYGTNQQLNGLLSIATAALAPLLHPEGQSEQSNQLYSDLMVRIWTQTQQKSDLYSSSVIKSILSLTYNNLAAQMFLTTTTADTQDMFFTEVAQVITSFRSLDVQVSCHTYVSKSDESVCRVYNISHTMLHISM